MQLPTGTIVAVTDGAKLLVFRNTGNELTPELALVEHPEPDADNKGSGLRHHSSSANPDESRLQEDSHAAGTAEYLNKLASSGKISGFVVVADPKSLGEMRKHYGKALEGKLIAEIGKDLTGQPIPEIAKALSAHK